MKRISKRVREEAALICAIAASTPGVNSYDVARERDVDSRAKPAWLARRAISHTLLWCHEVIVHREQLTAKAQMYGHAEALLRTGWSPS